jgi:hypothetical protein
MNIRSTCQPQRVRLPPQGVQWQPVTVVGSLHAPEGACCDHLQPSPHAPGSESLHVVRAGSRSIVTRAFAESRLLGASAEAVGRAIREYLAFVPALLGDDPWARKW